MSLHPPPAHYDVAAEVRSYEQEECEMYSWRTSDEGLVVVSTDGGPEWIPTLLGPNAVGLEQVLARWGDMLRLVSGRWSLPEGWLPAMCWRESGGNPTARNIEGTPDIQSDDGIGLFQITSVGLKAGHTEAQLFEPRTNAEVAGRYIAQRIVAGAPHGLGYGYDLPRVAAAFNAGSARPDPSNPWNLHCTGSHVHAVVAASNYQILRVRSAAELAVAAQFDLVAMLDLVGPSHRERTEDA